MLLTEPDAVHEQALLDQDFGSLDDMFPFHMLNSAHFHVRAVEGEKEGNQTVNAGPEDNAKEKGGKRGGPKKLFKWNEDIRSDI